MGKIDRKSEDFLEFMKNKPKGNDHGYYPRIPVSEQKEKKKMQAKRNRKTPVWNPHKSFVEIKVDN